MKKIYLAAMLAAFTFGGCAAILNGSHSTVHFDSDPPGAKVFVNGSSMGTTPVELSIAKKKDLTVEFRKQGFDNQTKIISSSAGAGWVICDILFTGVIGVIIDATTNSWNGLDDEYVKVALEVTKGD